MTIINSIMFAGYLGIILIILLVVKLIFELVKGTRSKYLKTLRILLNFGIILTFCYGSFLSLALIVRPPSEISGSKEQSLKNLSQWIINEELKIITVGIVLIFVLGYLSYLYQQKIEKMNLVRPIITLTIINFLILITSLLIIYDHTYNGLAIEVGYHFE